MRSLKTALLYGFLVWLIPFVVSFLVFPLRTSNRALFESIMPVVVTFCVVLFGVLYLRKPTASPLREGTLLGTLWLAISIVIDLAMFMEGPMKMSLPDYIADIGLTYLIIPTATAGMGWVLQDTRSSQA